MTLIEKLRKYQPRQVKLINMNTLLVKKNYHRNQQQIIQQAKFNYSPLRKALEKQIKTIEDQGKKQVKAIQYNKQIVNKDDYKDKLLLSKERKIFKDIYNKRLDKIEELNNKIDYDDLDYVVYKSNMEYNFSIEKDPITFLNDIKKGETSLEEAKNRQKKYLRYLNIIRKGNKNAEQRKTLANINMLYNARKDADCLFFVPIKRNYYQSIQQHN